MFAFVLYNNYRKENTFEIKYISPDVTKVKRAAFHAAKSDIPSFEKTSEYYKEKEGNYGIKINTRVREHNVLPKNQIIVEYNLVFVKVYGNESEDEEVDYEIVLQDSMVYAVIELSPNPETEDFDPIDDTILINF